MKARQELKEYLVKIKSIEDSLLTFLDNENNYEENYQNLINQIRNNYQIDNNSNEFKEFLHILAKVSRNHHNANDICSKIDRIISEFKSTIMLHFSNNEIFIIFKACKRIVLYLLEEKIIIPNQYMSSIITSKKYLDRYYPHFFYKEFKDFFTPTLRNEVETKLAQIVPNQDDSIYEQKRKDGVNDLEICRIIRNDSVDEFKQFLVSSKMENSTHIQQSIFETNHFLLKKTPSLIKYAAFYGSINIFKFLISDSYEFRPSMWIYAIHGNSSEIIKLLEEHKVANTSEICFYESIKCHHRNLAKYYHSMCIDIAPRDILYTAIKSFNYSYLPDEIDNEITTFFAFCRSDYCEIVRILLKCYDFDLNAKII